MRELHLRLPLLDAEHWQHFIFVLAHEEIVDENVRKPLALRIFRSRVMRLRDGATANAARAPRSPREMRLVVLVDL